MNRFDISLFGFRLIARGNAGITGALLAMACCRFFGHEVKLT